MQPIATYKQVNATFKLVIGTLHHARTVNFRQYHLLKIHLLKSFPPLVNTEFTIREAVQVPKIGKYPASVQSNPVRKHLFQRMYPRLWKIALPGQEIIVSVYGVGYKLDIP